MTSSLPAQHPSTPVGFPKNGTTSPEVLVRLPNWVGDACMALPALRALEAAGFRLTLMGKHWAQGLFAGHSWDFLPVQTGWRATAASARRWRSQRSSARGLVLPNSFSSALSLRWAGLPTAGLSTDHRAFLLKWSLTEPAATHEVRRFYAVAAGALAAWGRSAPPEPDPFLGLRLHSEHRARAEELLAAHGVTEPYVVLAPLATGLHHGKIKHWAGFTQLGAWLHQAGWRVLTCPPASEAVHTQAVLPHATVLPPMDLGCFAAVLASATLAVANDSGPSHIAAAVGTAQLTIHGVTDPSRTGAWSAQAEAIGGPDGWPSWDNVREAVARRLQS